MKRVFIANRGAVAVRIIRACRKLGLESVVPYTDADRDWLPRDLADHAVRVGDGPAKSSYLAIDTILEACRISGADALHPGYGFLSENAEFAQRVIDEGLTFIGPQPSVMALMADKGQAKAFAEAAGVPTIPGQPVETDDEDALRASAATIGYPIMLKAVAGGGGMGIRLVESEETLVESCASVKQEALSSFQDDRLIIEKFLPAVRHIEVQVIGDQHGLIVHAFDRECSVQRRRQKVLEEAPAPRLPSSLRDEMAKAAVALAQSAAYVGLGTVEFVVPVDKGEPTAFFFLEMNTRLQVEHGVTEEITGLDLVEMQIRIAQGEGLSCLQDQLSVGGHAIQARLCAEDPRQGLMPSSGTVYELEEPRPPVRWETGLRQGSSISGYYDSLLGKVIGTGTDRKDALAALRSGLRDVQILGVCTNGPFVASLLDDEAVTQSTADTRFVDREMDRLVTDMRARSTFPEAAVAAVLMTLKDASFGQGLRVQRFERSISLRGPDGEVEVRLSYQGEGVFCLPADDGPRMIRASLDGTAARLAVDGVEHRVHYKIDGSKVYFSLPNAQSVVFEDLSVRWRGRSAQTAADPGLAVSPMTGLVVSVLVAEGERVTKGQRLVVLESMKMEHGVAAQRDGVVAAITIKPGATIKANQPLLSITDDFSKDIKA